MKLEHATGNQQVVTSGDFVEDERRLRSSLDPVGEYGVEP